MVCTRRGLKRARSMRRMTQHLSVFSYVVRLQNNICWFCNEGMGSDCTKEHLLPQKLGGTDSWPVGNLKAAHAECNSAAGHLPVEIKYKLRDICTSEGKAEMFRVARQFRRAQAREAFAIGIPYNRWS